MLLQPRWQGAQNSTSHVAGSTNMTVQSSKQPNSIKLKVAGLQGKDPQTMPSFRQAQARQQSYQDPTTSYQQ